MPNKGIDERLPVALQVAHQTAANVARKRAAAQDAYPGAPADIALMRFEYRLDNGKELDLEHPFDIAAKLHWLKLHDRNPAYARLVDKHAARDVVGEIVGSQYLSLLFASGPVLSAIDPANLPANSMLKATHGWNMNFPILERMRKWPEGLMVLTAAWLRTRHELYHGEWPYSLVRPNLMFEELLVPKSGDLYDFKFYCFNGEPHFFKIDGGRSRTRVQGHFDLAWNALPCQINNYGPLPTVIRPANWDDMVAVASSLCFGLPFVRIDMYNLDGRIVFGEFTLYPQGGNLRFEPYDFSLYAGSLLDLSGIKGT